MDSVSIKAIQVSQPDYLSMVQLTNLKPLCISYNLFYWLDDKEHIC
jgi:hypothetical protein